MKKIVLLFVFALCVSTLSYGQFALGVKLGYNASKLSANVDSIKSSFNSGFHIGVWSRFRTFPTTILPIISGWKQKIKIGSVDVPVMVGFKIIHSDFITWRIELGPQASFVVNQKIEDVNSVTGPIKDASLSSVNWYVLGGTGIDILFLKLDIKYQYGLNQLVKDVETTGGTTTSSFDSKNQMFVVSLGFKILGKK